MDPRKWINRRNMKMREDYFSALFISSFKIILKKTSKYCEKGKILKRKCFEVIFKIMNRLQLMEMDKNVSELENV